MWGPGPLLSTMEVSVVAESTAGCGSVESNTIEIYVFEELLAGSISTVESPICYGFTSAFSASDAPSGENLSYQWWLEEPGGDFTELPGEGRVYRAFLQVSLQLQTWPFHTPARMVVGLSGPSLRKLKSYRNCKHLKSCARVRLETICHGYTGPTISNAPPRNGWNGILPLRVGRFQTLLSDLDHRFHQPGLLHVWHHDGNNLRPLGGYLHMPAAGWSSAMN